MSNLYFLLVHPAPYHEFFLKNLEQQLSHEVNIKVYFMQETNSLYPWKSNFRNGFNSVALSGSFFNAQLIKKIISDKDATFILVGWERIDKLFLIILMSILGRKYLIYTDTPHDKRKRSYIKKTVRNAVLKFIAKTAYGLIVTGNIGVRVVKNWPIKFKHIINLPTFVDQDFFVPGEKKNDPSGIVNIFSSGRLFNQEKGYDVALRALSKFKKSGTSKAFIYEIAGEGPDRNIIEALILELDLVNEVRLLGWAEPKKLLKHYQNCDIFLHPSRQDAYPNVIMEAMACGCVVIASDNAGSAVDRIIHGKSGYLFQTTNSESLETILNFALANSDQNTNLGNEALKTSKMFSILFGVNQIKKILDDSLIE